MRFSILLGSLMTFAYPIALLFDDKWAAMGVLLAAGAVGGFAQLIYNVTQMSVRQRLCPPHLLGRMNASVRFIVWGIMPVSALTAGWAGEALGIGNLMWITAALGVLAFAPLWHLRRHLAN